MGNSISSPKISTSGAKHKDDSLQLVLYVLSIVKELIKHLEKDFDPRDKRYGFLGNFHAAATVLDGHLCAIEVAGKADQFKAQILELAGLLEEVFDEAVIDVAQLELSQNTPYRRLRAVQKIIPKTDGWETRLQEVQLVSIARSGVLWDQLERRLGKLSDELQQFGEDMPDIAEKPLPLITPPHAAGEVMAFAERIFSALSCSKCVTTSQREIRLKIGTYRKEKKRQGTACLCILLARDSPPRSWHEVLIHDTQQHGSTVRMTRVKYAATNTTPGPMETWRMIDPKPYPCICSVLKTHSETRSDFWRLNIVLDPAGAGIHSHHPDERTHKQVSLKHQVNLKTLLASQDKDWTEMAKTALAVLLAYSLFYLYGGSWAKERWSRTNIFFFGDGTRIPLRPFLSSDPQKLGGPLYNADGQHKYPEFLELGVILLEIHLGQKLDSYLGLETEISDYDDLWYEASKVFRQRRLYFISTVYRNAIEKCLKPDFSVSGTCDDQKLRDSLFRDIVQPLEIELGRVFQEFISHESLDEDAERNIDLGSKVLRILPIPAVAKAAVSLLGSERTVLYSSPLNIQLELPQNQEIPINLMARVLRPTLPQVFELFGDENQGQPGAPLLEHYKKADNWKLRFQKLVNKHLGEDFPKDRERLKLAILDSGYDANHSYFYDESRIRDKMSWVNGPADEDSSGHGTHIAGIILDLTSNVDLYIGRITETRNVSDISHIPEAIRHAREVWKVDMISLSFGLKNRRIRKIYNEIEEARKANILIFAAANNDGGHAGRAYPGNHGDGVFCIHSATAEGNKVSYNPTPVPRMDNFSVVGDCISSCWPSLTESNRRKYMSGTSFATPVAVAVAAFMIEYVHKNMPQHVEWCVLPQTFSGMKQLFHMMVESRDRYDWVNLLGYFEAHKESKIMQDIEHILDI